MHPAPGVDGARPGAYVETVTGEASLVGLGSEMRTVDVQDARCAAKHAAMVARRESGGRVASRTAAGAVMHVELIGGPRGRCSVPIPVQAMWLSQRSQ